MRDHIDWVSIAPLTVLLVLPAYSTRYLIFRTRPPTILPPSPIQQRNNELRTDESGRRTGRRSDPAESARGILLSVYTTSRLYSRWCLLRRGYHEMFRSDWVLLQRLFP